MKTNRTSLKIILGIIIAVLALVAIYSGFKIITSLVAPKVATNDEPETKTVVKDGIEYFPRQDITTFMLMGIDRYGKVSPSDSYNNDGAADMIALLVMDNTAKTYDVLMLNRDTITQIPVIGVDGKNAGSITAQLALSHTYGSGMEDSCENVKRAVSDMLHNIDINYYMSMNMDAISILNDSVGGVSVNVTEDFSKMDASIPMGQTILRGDQALAYIRGRKDVGDQLNLTRMSRQQEYMHGFVSSVSAALDSNDNLAMDIYNEITPYVVSDCPINTFSNIINRCSEYTLGEIITPEGENKKGEQYMEFIVDSDSLEDITLDLFYSEKPNF